MPTIAKWRGTTAIKLQPKSPKFRRTATGAQLVFQFRGPYVDLRTYGPDIGDSITLGAFGYAPDDELIYAESVECEPDGAGEDGPGTLTVIYSNEGGGGTVLTGDVEAPTFEIDASMLEKRLETHKRYNNGASSPFAPYGFTAGTTTFDTNSGETVSVSEFWDRYKNASAKQRPLLRGEVPPGAPELLAMLDELAKKFFSGIESYIVGAPVARKTTRSYYTPAVGSLGAIGAPAGFGLPSGYQWLKTADRAVRQGHRGKWERVEEWTGADKWDADLYPP